MYSSHCNFIFKYLQLFNLPAVTHWFFASVYTGKVS